MFVFNPLPFIWLVAICVLWFKLVEYNFKLIVRNKSDAYGVVLLPFCLKYIPLSYMMFFCEEFIVPPFFFDN